jgi:hypothetical protein
MDALNVHTNTLQNGMLNSIDPKYNIVEYSHLEKSFIGGKDAGVFAVMIPSNGGVPAIGIETYTVINGPMLYQFVYSDLS